MCVEKNKWALFFKWCRFIAIGACCLIIFSLVILFSFLLSYSWGDIVLFLADCFSIVLSDSQVAVLSSYHNTSEVLLELFIGVVCSSFLLYYFIRLEVRKVVDWVQPNMQEGTVLLLSIASVLLLSLSIILPYSIDEIFTFNHYINKGPLVALSLYTGPNNHLLFSFLGSVLFKITASKWVALRMLSWVGNCFTIFFLLHGIKNVSLKNKVLTGVLFLFHFTFLFYVLQGRGYGITACLSMYLVYKMRDGLDGLSWNRLMTVGVLLIALLPTNAYFVLVVFVLRLVHSKDFSAGLRAIAVSISLVYLFYLPVLLVSSVQSILNNGWVSMHEGYFSWGNLKLYLNELLLFFGNESYFFFAIILIGFIIFIRQKNSPYFVLLFLPVFLVPVFHQHSPPVRIFVYLVPILIYIVVKALVGVQKSKLRRLGLSVVVVGLIVSNVKMYPDISFWLKETQNTNNVASLVHSYEVETVGVNDVDLYNCLLFKSVKGVRYSKSLSDQYEILIRNSAVVDEDIVNFELIHVVDNFHIYKKNKNE